MRAFPTEIEADLSLHHGFDIADWWTGKTSSRWVWVRVTHLPDDSATKKAMREGDWTEGQYITARLVNELAFFRADHAAVHAQHKMRPDPIQSPAQRREREEGRRQYREVRSMLLAQMRGEYIPPTRDVAFLESTDKAEGR